MRDSVLFASDGEAVPDTLDIRAQSCVCQFVETSGCGVVLAAALALLVDEGDGEDAPLVFGEAAARWASYSFLDFPGGAASVRQRRWEWDRALVGGLLDLVSAHADANCCAISRALRASSARLPKIASAAIRVPFLSPYAS